LSAIAGEGTPGSSERKITRNLKRRYDEIHNVEKPVEELTPIDQTLEKEHEELTKLKNIQVRADPNPNPPFRSAATYPCISTSAGYVSRCARRAARAPPSLGE